MVETYRRSLVCPNYTPKNWWECDVFELTEAGYFREYEIKLTLSDFRADAKKKSGGSMRCLGFQPVEMTKHQLLAARSESGPVEFNFVAPSGVIPISEIPEWAGLIEVQPFQMNSKGPYRVSLTQIKKAPRLHKKVSDPSIRKHVESVFYYRFNDLFLFRGLPLVEQAA